MKNIIIQKNEELILPIVWSGKEKEINYNIQLTGIGSSLTLLMLLLGKRENEVKIRLNINHQNNETKSNVIVKGIINDSASIDFEGRIRIESGSKGSNAQLSANLLLMSDNARGRAVPALEILENDVKAGHSTTIGRINDAELFYLMSRGLSKIKARDLIVRGFLNGFLQTFPEGSITKEVQKKLIYEK